MYQKQYAKEEKIELLFNSNYNDKKHKVNTTNKKIPHSIISSLEHGLTIEQIEQLTKQGFDIYTYKTQITLHGTCEEYLPSYIGNYKNIVLNKNKSIGVRWTAICGLLKKKVGIPSPTVQD